MRSWGKKSKPKGSTLVGVLFLTLVLMMSAAQAFMVSFNPSLTDTSRVSSSLPEPLLQDNYYTWEDAFTDATKVDPSMSFNYEITGGVVQMKNTFLLWTDPAWTRLKQITITNTAGELLYNYALHLFIPYDSEMRSDYGDLRFKHESSGDVLCNYWIENYDANAASVWVKIPYTPTGTS
ncbi:MAG: DUF2341 domain-containing protein, partial [Candidatus Thermoplasmatota archaeon]